MSLIHPRWKTQNDPVASALSLLVPFHADLTVPVQGHHLGLAQLEVALQCQVKDSRLLQAEPSNGPPETAKHVQITFYYFKCDCRGSASHGQSEQTNESNVDGASQVRTGPVRLAF